MYQVLFRIPDPTGHFPDGIPIFGFGAMLFLAFVVCVWLASRRAERAGIAREHIQDLAIWVFVVGLIGARIVYMIQYKEPAWKFFRIWEGGIVFYGSAIGGWLGYALAYFLVLRRFHISTWQLADVIAPTVAIGLAIGRIGCFLNGCCFGHACVPDTFPAQHFPILSSPAQEVLVTKGVLQSLAGFAMDDTVMDQRTVGAIEPNSSAARAGLRPGDVIECVNGQEVVDYRELVAAFYPEGGWPKGKTELHLTVRREVGGEPKEVELVFTPRTIGLYPTQLYESISMALLFLVLIAYYPIRRHNGQVFVLLMMGYAVHRFLNEQLRDDTDPVAFGMTLSQNVSLLVFVGALVLEFWLRRTQVPRIVLPADSALASDD